MKKLESLKANKFKGYELKAESHNSILGGWQGVTHRCGGDTCDEFNTGTIDKSTGMYPTNDVTTVKGVSAA